MLTIRKGKIGFEMKQKDVDAKLSLVTEATEEEVRIEQLIRERYTMSQECGLHRKQLMGVLPSEEWTEYCNYVEECIGKVRNAQEA